MVELCALYSAHKMFNSRTGKRVAGGERIRIYSQGQGEKARDAFSYSIYIYIDSIPKPKREQSNWNNRTFIDLKVFSPLFLLTYREQNSLDQTYMRVCE